MKINRYLIVLIFLLLSSVTLAKSFDINEFSDPKKYGWDDFEKRNQDQLDLMRRTRLLQLYETDKKSEKEILLKSMIFPGWGHYSINSYIKGHIFVGASVALLGSSFYYYTQSNEYYDKYKSATQISSMNSDYHDAEINRNTAIIFLSLYGILWGYNVYDSIQSVDRYNASVWDNIIRKTRDRISIYPTGIEVKF